MEINELMVGDLVNIAIEGYNNPTRIREIGSFWVKVIKDEMEYGDILVTPIPLTTEILEKNGFVYDSEDKLFEDIYPRISMLYAQYRLVEKGGINYGEMSEIKYVHQLQHALKLCGITKEIEL